MRKRKIDWVSAFPVIIVSVIALIVLQTTISMLDTEGWNPLVKVFTTVGVPIVIVAIVMMKLIAGFASKKDDGAPTITNPIISLVRRLRGKQELTAEQLACIHESKIVEEVFEDLGEEESIDEATSKTGRPMNPIILLVRRLRAKGG